LVVCVLAVPASTPARPTATQAGAGAEPIATQADAAVSVGLFVLQRLANYTANQNAGNDFGQFLIQLGFGHATDARLDQIRATLEEINGKVEALQRSISHLGCAVQKASLTKDRSAIENAWNRILITANKAKGESKPQQQQLQKDLRKDLLELDFAGTSPGQAATSIHNTLYEEMITDCGKAIEDKTEFITYALRNDVTTFVNFWQGLEAEATVINIGIEESRGNKELAKAAHGTAEKRFKLELTRVKPSLGSSYVPAVGANMVVDRRQKGLLWDRYAKAWTYEELLEWTKGTAKPGHGPAWEIPTISQLETLVRDCCGPYPSLEDWFNKVSPFRVEHWTGTHAQLISGTAQRESVCTAYSYSIPPICTKYSHRTRVESLKLDRGRQRDYVWGDARGYALLVRPGAGKYLY
jgi:hypothetical protein